MIKPRNITLHLPNLTLKARQWGAEDATRVLALHGWMDNAASFDPIASHLHGLNLVALDLPGHGHSDHIASSSGLHFIDFVPTIMEAADALGWENFILIGHSMGAAIGTLVAGCFPDRIQKMILLEGIGPLSQTADETPERLLKAIFQEKKIAKRARRHFPSIQSAISARMSGSDLDHNSAQLLVERSLVKEVEGFRFSHDPRLRATSRLRLTEEMVLVFIRHITCPSLFVKADKGWPFPEDLVEKRLESFRNLKKVEMAGGHHVHMTHPKEVAVHVNSFL